MVSDTGIGIRPEYRDKVFERFFQADASRKSGNGIGLSLVKAFVELHGGSISLESEEGKGSCFTVEIPVKHIAEQESSVARTLIDANTVNTELDPLENHVADNAEGKPVVLVIEDNSDLLKLLRQTLSADYQVLTAANGADGLRMALKYVPDLVVSDVMMPEMDGITLCEHLKNDLATSHIPVILLTAKNDEDSIMRGFESGAEAYVAKPFDPQILELRVKNILVHAGSSSSRL